MGQVSRLCASWFVALFSASVVVCPCWSQWQGELDGLNAPLLGGNSNDRFGESIVWAPDYVAVGAPRYDYWPPLQTIRTNSGVIHIYKPIGSLGRYTHETSLIVGDVRANDQFGSAIVGDNGWLVVGSPGRNGGPSGVGLPQSGAAHVLRRSPGGGGGPDNWALMGQELVHRSPKAIDLFGSSVAIDSRHGFPVTVAVGAPTDDAPSVDCGSVTIFELDSQGNFVDKALIGSPILPGMSSLSAQSGLFGGTVALHGDVLVVGAKRRTLTVDKQGLVFVFERNLPDGTPVILPTAQSPQPTWGPWKLRQVLTRVGQAVANEEFGSSMHLTGSRLFVGAPGGALSPGSASAFERVSNSSVWPLFAPLQILQHPFPVVGELFGSSVRMYGDAFFVGVPGFDAGLPPNELGSRGVVYQFSRLVGCSDWELGLTIHPFGSDTTSDPAVDCFVENAQFGSCLDVGNGLVFVGAPGANNTQITQGVVMVYAGVDGTCLGDFNGDLEVGGLDLGYLIERWGGSLPSDARVDLDNNKAVDGSDLTILLSSWGPCNCDPVPGNP